jgi:two-component system chemotaxis response regulator CheY
MTAVSHDDTRKTRQILIVEPDDDTRALFSQALQLAGCDVVEASDGRDALVKALAEPPSVVITETHLPILDGYALCEVLRRDPATRTVPILIVTRETRRTDLERARAAGADAILAKPAPLDVLLNEVLRLLAPFTESHQKPATARASGAEHQTQLASVSARSKVRPGKTQAQAHLRFETTKPRARPPDMVCPSCDRLLVYKCSHIGGVNSGLPEQWDDYVCPASCGTFEYRQRTRKLRRTGNA